MFLSQVDIGFSTLTALVTTFQRGGDTFVGKPNHPLAFKETRMEFNRVTVAVKSAVTQIDEVASALRFAGQDKNEPEFLNKNFSKLDQARTALLDAIDDPTLEDIGSSSVDAAENNPQAEGAPDKDAKVKRSLPGGTSTMARKPSEVRKGGELTSPANDVPNI
jgi:hypothetical protein